MWTAESIEKRTSMWGRDEITVGGRIIYSNKDKAMRIDINYNGILSKLIQEAGRYCDFYASDLFIQWKSIEENLKDCNYMKTSGGKYLFGFRESGVDHTEWIVSRLNEYGEYYYRSIWVLDIQIVGYEERYDVNTADVTMKLQRIIL